MSPARNPLGPARSGARPARRELLRAGLGVGAALAGGGAIALMACEKKPPATRVKRGVHLLQWSSFVKQADDELRRQSAEFEKQSGVTITIETINANDLNARSTAAVESRQGPDIIQFQFNQTHLYAGGCSDVDEAAQELGEAHGGWHASSIAAATVEGRFKAIPYSCVGGAVIYREDKFRELGIASFPDTYDELLRAGTKLKQAGLPIGQTLGHTFADAAAWCYPLMWAFGAQEVAEDGTTVVINSPQMVQALTFMREFWKAACDEGGLAWDDTSNNRAFLSGTISATQNGASIYVVARTSPDQYPGLADKVRHALLPRGPTGKRFNGILSLQHAIMDYSPNQEAALEFVRFLMARENYERWFTISNGFNIGAGKMWQTHPLWERDPRITIFRELPFTARLTGYAGPYNQKASEVQAKHIIVDVFAKVVQGTHSPQAALAWAESELRHVYQRA